MTSKFKSWMTELRAPFLTATIVSIILGTTIAWTRNDVFSPAYFLLALLGAIFSHLGTNIANDYFDHKSGNDEVNKEFVRPFSGGSRTIQMGWLTPREVLGGAIFFFTSATLIGIYFSWVVGPIVLILVVAGLISGAFYTGKPFNWAGKGTGEALVAVNFGALMTLGAYLVQTQKLVFEPIFASIPVSLLIAAVLYINEFPDYTADKAVGKDTLVVRLGRQKATYGYGLIVSFAYVFVFLNVLLGVAPVYTLFALIPLPLAVEAIKHALRFHSEPFRLIPANALTVVFHFLTSILISLGYLSCEFEATGLTFLFILAMVGMCAAITAYFYLKVEKTKSPSAMTK